MPQSIFLVPDSNDLHRNRTHKPIEMTRNLKTILKHPLSFAASFPCHNLLPNMAQIKHRNIMYNAIFRDSITRLRMEISSLIIPLLKFNGYVHADDSCWCAFAQNAQVPMQGCSNSSNR
jgi:hypothetical protein